MKKLILIDGNAIAHRAFHAIRPLTTHNGELVNAVFGFTSMLLNILSQENPDYIICTFDAAKKTFRHEQYEDYKATRVSAPDEFYAQIPRIYQIVEAFEIPLFVIEGYEADDTIGTIAKKAEKISDLETIIVTGDMDALQLVNDKVNVSTLHKGYSQTVRFDPNGVREKYGLEPKQIIDFKGLSGDSSDNIPGVMGIGPKTATRLLQNYGDIKGVYENLDKIQGKIHEKLEKDKDKAFLSRDLATIRTDIDLDFNLENCHTHEFNLGKVIELFESLQFFSLIRRLRKWKEENGYLAVTKDPETSVKKVENEQLSLF